MTGGSKENPWFDAGLWRMEIQESEPAKKTEFLVILKPLKSSEKPVLDYTAEVRDQDTKLTINGKTLIFSKNPGKSKGKRFFSRH